MNKRTLDFQIRRPDISSLIKIGKKYQDIIMQNSEYITEICNKWNEVIFDKWIPFASIMEPNPFPEPGMVKSFSDDWIKTSLLTLSIAWAIGREYAEVNSRTAKFGLAVEDYESTFFPQSTKNELLDLSDSAAFLILSMLIAFYKVGELDEKTLFRAIELDRKIFREGILLVFKSGIAGYYKEGNAS